MEKLALKIPGGRIDPVAGMPSGGDETLQSLITNGFTWAFIIVTVTALIFLIWGGISWIMSQGDKSKVEGARKRITYAIIGLIVAFASFMIINTVGTFFGVKLLNIPGRAPGRACDIARDCGRPTQWECVLPAHRCRER